MASTNSFYNDNKVFVWVVVTIISIFVWGALEPEAPKQKHYDNGGTCDYGSDCNFQYVEPEPDYDQPLCGGWQCP